MTGMHARPGQRRDDLTAWLRAMIASLHLRLHWWDWPIVQAHYRRQYKRADRKAFAIECEAIRAAMTPAPDFVDPVQARPGDAPTANSGAVRAGATDEPRCRATIANGTWRCKDAAGHGGLHDFGPDDLPTPAPREAASAGQARTPTQPNPMTPAAAASPSAQPAAAPDYPPQARTAPSPAPGEGAAPRRPRGQHPFGAPIGVAVQPLRPGAPRLAMPGSWAETRPFEHVEDMAELSPVRPWMLLSGPITPARCAGYIQARDYGRDKGWIA